MSSGWAARAGKPTGEPMRCAQLPLVRPTHLLETSYSWASTAQGTPATLTVSCTSCTCWPRLEPLMVTRVPPSTGPVSGSTCSKTWAAHLHPPVNPWQPRQADPASHLWAPWTHSTPAVPLKAAVRKGHTMFQRTEWMRGAGHRMVTASTSPQASWATQRGRSPLHHTQPYWGLAVWQRLQSPCPTEQSYSTTGGSRDKRERQAWRTPRTQRPQLAHHAAHRHCPHADGRPDAETAPHGALAAEPHS